MLPARSFCALGPVVRFVARNALASVSSLNEQSFEFHRTSGFECCETSSELGWKPDAISILSGFRGGSGPSKIAEA
jgi:hypothetical protein